MKRLFSIALLSLFALGTLNGCAALKAKRCGCPTFSQETPPQQQQHGLPVQQSSLEAEPCS